MRQMLRRALPIAVLQYRKDRLLAQQVRQILASTPGESHNATTLSRRLHVSARTLHRQLLEEGASLQGLKDEARFELARNLLNRTHKPVKQVAHATGFKNEKSFSRAFSGWAGVTPGAFRQQNKA
jgi:AraC-like DNA-binding protein